MGALLLGSVAGAVISGYLADAIGRKWTKVVSGSVYAIAALACAFSQSTGVLIGARFALGLSVGTASFVLADVPGRARSQARPAAARAAADERANAARVSRRAARASRIPGPVWESWTRNRLRCFRDRSGGHSVVWPGVAA